MASKIKVDQIEGSTASTITIPTGQTFTVTDGIPVASGGTGLASFTAGDILYATGATTLTKLNKGTAEQVLAMNAGATAPDWGSVDLTVLPTITVAKGGTNIASFTAGDILYATGATTLTKLAKGSAADVLTMNTGATAPEWAAAAGGGAWTYLNTTTLSSASTADIETGLDSTYPLYAMMFKDIEPSADGYSFFMRVKQGGSYQTANYQYHSTTAHSDQAAFDYSNANSTSHSGPQVISVGVGNAAVESANGIFYIPNPAGTTFYKNCWWDVTALEGSGAYLRSIGHGGRDDAAAVTGVQFYFGSGTMDGTIALYGIKQS